MNVSRKNLTHKQLKSSYQGMFWKWSTLVYCKDSLTHCCFLSFTCLYSTCIVEGNVLYMPYTLFYLHSD